MRLKVNTLSVFIFSLQIAFLGLIALDCIGLEIPILRQALGFIFLTFIPGILLLGILRINNLSTTETILYSVGLSLSFLMFIGFLINLFYPLIGIPKPISETPLVFTMCSLIILLCIILYSHNKEFRVPLSNIKEVTSPMVLLSALLPFVSIFGAYYLNYYNDNTILLALFGIISIIPIFVLLGKITDKIYPLIIWVISISLLFSIVLAVKYPSYGDATVELYYANLVYMNGIWDSSIFGGCNAMLRIVMLHPIYCVLLKMEPTYVFRVVHPLLFSFTPLAGYVVFKRQTSEKIAFFSSFFFVSFFPFYVILSRNTRTGIAELFLVLFVLSMTDRNIDTAKKSLLSIIFALSIVVSHYGTSYFLMLSLIPATLFLVLIKKYRSQHLSVDKGIRNPSINFTLLYLVFTFAWYIYNSSASTFNIFINFFSHMADQLSELFGPETSQTIYALYHEWVFSIEVSRDLILIATIFIVIGIIDLTWNIVKRKTVGFQEEFAVFSLVYLGLLLATILPTKGFSSARGYHLSLIFLAPFSMIGFIKLFEGFRKVFKSNNTHDSKNYLKMFAVFLMVFLLFNSGFVSEVITKGGDYSPNIIISKPRESDIHDAQYLYSIRREIILDQEVFSGKWLLQQKDKSKVYLDPSTERALISSGDSILSNPYVRMTNSTVVRKGYIFLDTINVIRGVSIIQTNPPKIENTRDVYPLNTSNKIYTNGGSEIYYR